jgi:hypothetical protein
MNKTQLELTHTEIFADKLENTYWSDVNKRYLLRLYEPMNRVMEMVSNPKWSTIIQEMLGYNHKGYYATVYKSLKEIGVLVYNPTLKILEKGPNYERFYSDEDWSWFYMNTSSGRISYEIFNKNGHRVTEVYQSNYRNNK